MHPSSHLIQGAIPGVGGALFSGLSETVSNRRLTTHRPDPVSNNHFKPLSENELSGLKDDALIAYIRKATDAGRPDAARTAIAILCNRRFDDLVRLVAIKVPAADVEDVAMTIITSALKSAFDGSSVGEFVKWLSTIRKRRIADYFRDRERDPDTVPMPEEHQDDDDIWGEQPATGSEIGVVDVESVIARCLEKLSDPHRDVIELNVFQDLSAPDTADTVNEHFPDLDPPMTPANVHKIVSRFREDLRDELDDD